MAKRKQSTANEEEEVKKLKCAAPKTNTIEMDAKYVASVSTNRLLTYISNHPECCLQSSVINNAMWPSSSLMHASAGGVVPCQPVQRKRSP
jgi:hypothetical protein